MAVSTYALNTSENFREDILKLRAGDRVLLTGTIYTARDAAHKELFRLLDSGEPLPFDINGAVIYYAGPTPARKGQAVGSCGPTTSGRMDRFAPRLLDLGLAAMIGKGERGDGVKQSVLRNKAVYLCAVGGAGALIARHITAAEEIAFPELGCESIKKFTVKDMPLTVSIDSLGNDLFVSGRQTYAENI